MSASGSAISRQAQNIAPTALPNVLSMHTRGFKLEGSWPTLFWGPEVLPEIQRKVNQLPWARSLLNSLLTEAAVVCRQEPELPIRPIGWRHAYYSPETGEHLAFNPQKRVHIDPWNQAMWQGEKFENAWTLLVHERTYRLMRHLACLYRLTDNETYGRWAVAGLRQAVAMFRRNDLRSGQHQALYFQPLYDSQVLALIANTCAFLQGSPIYDSNLHAEIVTDIFESAMPYQIKFAATRGAHNMTCYVDAALLFAGLLLERQDWLELAVNHPQTGFYAMLENGLACDPNGQIDGFWCESLFYHYYSLYPLLSLFARLQNSPLAEAYPQARQSAEIQYRLTRMLLAPAEMADHRLRLPLFGDLGAPKHMKLSGYAPVYEMGAGVLPAPELQTALGALYYQAAARTSMEALCFGPDALNIAPPNAKSVHLPATGAVFLRDQGIQAYLKCGMPATSHDHADRLSFGLSTDAAPLIADLGTAGYADRAYHAYCRSAVAHSTILVDDHIKQPIVDVDLSADLEHHQAAAHMCLEGNIRLQRHMELKAPYMHLTDTCTAAEPHVLTWLMHPYGSAAVSCGEEIPQPDIPALPDNETFCYLTQRRLFSTQKPVCVDWQVAENLYLRAWVVANVPFVCILAHSPGNPKPDRRTTLALRLQSAAAVIKAVLEIYTAQPQLMSPPELLTQTD
ncbi:MAG: heparinase II/III domain-containing protein [Limnochordia bacterium]|jgi:hypothetical protein